MSTGSIVGSLDWLQTNCVVVSKNDASILESESWFLLQRDSPFWSSDASEFEALFEILNRLQAGILGTNYLYNSMLISHWITLVYAHGNIVGFIFMDYEYRTNFPLADWPGYGTIKRASGRGSKSPRNSPVAMSEIKSYYFHVSSVCRSTYADLSIGIGKRLMDFQKVIVCEMAKINPDYKNLIVIDAVETLDTALYPSWGFSKIANRADGVTPMAMIVETESGLQTVARITETDINTDVEAMSYSEINAMPVRPHLSALQGIHDATMIAVRLPKADAKFMPAVIDALMHNIELPSGCYSGYSVKEIQRLLKYRKTKIAVAFAKPRKVPSLSADFLAALRQ